MTSRLRAFLLAAAAWAVAGPAAAAPDEIQVATDEIVAPGSYGLELHINHALHGLREPGYPGQLPSHHVLQATPEFSYGIDRTLEAGLFLPVVLAPDGGRYLNGVRGRLKYIAPREEGAKFFWGLNTELGYNARRSSESYVTLELRPILGYRDENWLLSLNPILSTNLSPTASRATEFEPALKVARRAGEELHAGFEYYGAYGPVSHFAPAGERQHYLYGVLDFETGGVDFNIGIGRGKGDGADRWVAKAIIAFSFN
jgi:hypothetical protein